MEMRESIDGVDARRGFWTAVIIGLLYLATAYANPVVGLVYSIVFLAAAWGIRKGNAWAAIAAALILVAPVAGAMFRGNFSGKTSATEMISIAVGVCLLLFAAILLARAAWELWRGPQFSMWMAVLALALVGSICYRPMMIPTGGMEDTLLIGDQMLVNTIQRHPHRGDMVLFEYPIDRKNIFVKRVAAVAGDRVHLENKKLFVNGAAVDEPYVRNKTTIIDYFRDNFPRAPNVRIYAPAEAMLNNNFREGDIVVPEGKYFVLGDNRDYSLDSRYWGFIAESDIIGRPVLIYASFDTPDGKAANIFTTRWNRLFHVL